MAHIDQDLDEALLGAPWTTPSGSTYLMKYTCLQDGSYVFLATDLSSVLLETLSSTSIPTRLDSIALRQKKISIGSPDKAAVQEALKRLAEVMVPGTRGTKVEVEKDEYFDAVFHISNGDFAWIFNTTELRGRQPLEIIARHLVTPLSRVLAQDRGIDATGPSTSVTSRVCSDPGVVKAIRRLTSNPNQTRSSSHAPSTPSASRQTPSSRTPAATPTFQSGEESFIVPPAAQRTRSNIPVASCSSRPTPDEDDEEEDAEEEDESGYDLPHHPLPSQIPPPSPQVQPTYTSSPAGRSPGTPAQTPSRSRGDDDAPASPSPTPTPTPVKKSKLEIEAEADAEMEKRREEMRQRATAGAGGRLARRRR